MRNRIIPLALIALLVILHGQLWYGRGSLPNVSSLAQELEAKKARNERERQGNERLEAEVRDLQEGMDIVEEKARFELGMVRPNEIMVQIAK
ncbi:MAG: septum formation initiator family protein [Rhodoferax sp.]|nr:septum formation initiator family protein [Rhodoferax sp.]MBP9929355.1 septum formation initiator family protein [Rhodoferax sp.]HQX61562.1 septum formation initiator family protein [Burkholderiaceae bacterium]HQZ07615.1 septum formation initiator family protein [Burkholderiaceae bacterium]